MARSKTKKSLYFIAIIPQPTVWDAVMGFKRVMADKFNCRFPLKLPPHITLQIPFYYPDGPGEEQGLIEGLHKFCRGEVPFMVRWDGFGHFRRDVIFVAVENQSPVMHFQQRMANVLAGIPGFPAGRLTEMTHTHMTIGNKDLKPEFGRAWDYFAKKEYKAQTEVGGIHLLKHNQKFWEMYGSIPFSVA